MQNPYIPYKARIKSVKQETQDVRTFKIEPCNFDYMPGQFLELSIPGIGEAPISVSSSPTRGDYLELGVRKAGTLTGAMHEFKVGDVIGLRGPFGTFFDTEAMKSRDLLLISGGCGLAPMRALIQYVEDCRDDFGKVTVLYGAKSPDDILYKDELIEWQNSESLVCQYTVDNVPQGTCWDANVGLITELIPPLQIDVPKTVAVIVGPPVMYRFVIQELNSKGVKDENIIVSLERYMKCGVGKCGHCQINGVYVCQEGPVFTLAQLRNLREAV